MLKQKVDLLPYLNRRFPEAGRSGDEVLLDCPECGDTGKFNLWFNVVKNKGYCYKCHCNFTPITLIRRVENCSLSVATGILHSHTEFSHIGSKDFKAMLVKALSSASAEPVAKELNCVDFPEGFVSSEVECHPYILERVLTVEEARFYGLGHCVAGYYANRAIVPVYVNGKMVTFVARLMSKKCKRCGGEGCKRCGGVKYVPYLYPKGCQTGQVLFNYDNAKDSDHIVLTEGAFDAMRVGPRGVAVLGSTLSSHQVALLLATKATRITLLFDPDKAGDAAAQQSLQRLKDFYRRVSIVRLPTGKDPDDFSREELWTRIDSAPAVGTLAYVKKRLAELDY